MTRISYVRLASLDKGSTSGCDKPDVRLATSPRFDCAAIDQSLSRYNRHCRQDSFRRASHTDRPERWLETYVFLYVRLPLSRSAAAHDYPEPRQHDALRSELRRAFSLLELLAVVAILGSSRRSSLPRVVSCRPTYAKEKCCLHNRTEINITVEQYYIHNGVWPADDLSDIGADLDYFPDGLPTCPVSGHAYRLGPDDASRGRSRRSGRSQPVMRCRRYRCPLSRAMLRR